MARTRTQNSERQDFEKRTKMLIMICEIDIHEFRIGRLHR